MEGTKESSEQPVSVTPTKRTSALGVGALVLGTIACLICWIPLLGLAGLPLAIIGLALGIAGIIVATATKRYSVALPVAGATISVAAVFISIVVTVVTSVTVGRIARRVETVKDSYGSDTRWLQYTKVRQKPYREITLPHAHSHSHFTLSPDRQKGLYGDYIHPVCYFIDMNSVDILKELESHIKAESIQCAALSSDGKRAVSGGGWFTDLSFWDRLRGKQEKDYWTLRFWDLASGKQLGHARGKDDYIRSVAYSPVDNQALSGGSNGDILLWDLEKMQVLKRFVGHSYGIRRNCLVWSKDGKTFLSGSWDGSVRLWDLETGEELAHLQPGYGRVMSLALSPDAKYALSSYLNGPNQPVILWDLEDQQEITRFGVPGNPWFANQQLHVASVAFSPDGKTALFGLVFGTVIWWDLNEWRQFAMNRLHEKELAFVAYSADGKSSISVGWDTTTVRENVKVKFWKLPDRDTIKESK